LRSTKHVKNRTRGGIEEMNAIRRQVINQHLLVQAMYQQPWAQ
jgi:hypothetical protein